MPSELCSSSGIDLSKKQKGRAQRTCTYDPARRHFLTFSRERSCVESPSGLAVNSVLGVPRVTSEDPATPLREAEATFARSEDLRRTQHLPGVRDARRELLLAGLAQAEIALSRCDPLDLTSSRGIRRLLVRIQTERAEDARYGAGQLSRGAQRAPTVESCDDGWERVLEIVVTSERCALEAERHAIDLGDPKMLALALSAKRAARDARAMLSERNFAYTFHANPKFSFGEGWYVAAAGVLSRIQIQIEPYQQHTAAVALFLEQTGLTPCVVPYRPRPKANKALPDLIAQAFRRDPLEAQTRVRTAFLGDGQIPSQVQAWSDEVFQGAPWSPKVLCWVRRGHHHPTRNTEHAEIVELCRVILSQGAAPVLIGDALPGEVPEGAFDLTLFWQKPMFQGIDMRRCQLSLFEHLRSQHQLVGQVGVTTAGMDGPALLGLPTVYITEEPNVRLGRWVGAIPGYTELVRSTGYREAFGAELTRWLGDKDRP
jgi:hypothetical protein